MLCAFANEQFNVLLFSLGCKQQNSSSVMFEELVMLLPLEQERPSQIIKKTTIKNVKCCADNIFNGKKPLEKCEIDAFYL